MTETHRFGRRLRRGRWTVRDAGDLQRVIARAVESEAQWQGIAYTRAPIDLRRGALRHGRRAGSAQHRLRVAAVVGDCEGR